MKMVFKGDRLTRYGLSIIKEFHGKNTDTGVKESLGLTSKDWSTWLNVVNQPLGEYNRKGRNITISKYKAMIETAVSIVENSPNWYKHEWNIKRTKINLLISESKRLCPNRFKLSHKIDKRTRSKVKECKTKVYLSNITNNQLVNELNRRLNEATN